MQIRYLVPAVILTAALTSCASTTISAADHSFANAHTCDSLTSGEELVTVDIADGVETAALPSTEGASPTLRALIHDWAKKMDAWENIDVDQQESAKGKAVQSAMQTAFSRAERWCDAHGYPY